MTHTGITSGCANCHADGQGPSPGFRGWYSRAPRALTCRSTVPGARTATSRPRRRAGFAGTTMVHTGLNGLSNCASCHENNAADLGYFGLTAKMVVRPPISARRPTRSRRSTPTTRPAATARSVIARRPPSLRTSRRPTNHIPVGATACTNCHIGHERSVCAGQHGDEPHWVYCEL